MIYIAILTATPWQEVESICRRIGENISRFLDDYPDRENTFVEPLPEAPAVYVQQALARTDLTPAIAQRLAHCTNVLCFEGPQNPLECPDQVSILKLYLQALEGSVIDWGGIDYGWPLIQLSEDALKSLSELPDEPRLSSEELE